VNFIKKSFPKVGNDENSENGRSQSWEASKTKKIAVPKVGNSKKCQIQLFPTLGTEKIPV
jgi:hypothetical protein